MFHLFPFCKLLSKNLVVKPGTDIYEPKIVFIIAVYMLLNVISTSLFSDNRPKDCGGIFGTVILPLPI
jgi:hypothetical protein